MLTTAILICLNILGTEDNKLFTICQDKAYQCLVQNQNRADDWDRIVLECQHEVELYFRREE